MREFVPIQFLVSFFWHVSVSNKWATEKYSMFILSEIRAQQWLLVSGNSLAKRR